ncbi:MAG: hypothetical protein HY904_06100 [Deltaproteobacteria bacterium]|nr:hypothetical protein [Deltaproteobacteria bacterium]
MLTAAPPPAPADAPVTSVAPLRAGKPPARDVEVAGTGELPTPPAPLLPPGDTGMLTPTAPAATDMPATEASAGVRNVDVRQVPDTLLVSEGTAVRVGQQLACIRVVSEDAASLEVRLKLHDGMVHVDARGPGAAVLHGRVNDLVTALRGDGLQLGTFRHDDGGGGAAWQSPRDGTGDAQRPETAPAQTRTQPSTPARGPGRYA